MNKKKILIVGRDFYPLLSPRAFRTTELAKELAKQGHEVTVITCFSTDIDYINLGLKLNILFKDLGAQKYRILKLNGNKVLDLLKRLINRFALMAIEFPDIQLITKVSRALRNEYGYDLLISIAVPFPIHWGVALARSEKKPIAKTWKNSKADCLGIRLGTR